MEGKKRKDKRKKNKFANTSSEIAFTRYGRVYDAGTHPEKTTVATAAGAPPATTAATPSV